MTPEIIHAERASSVSPVIEQTIPPITQKTRKPTKIHHRTRKRQPIYPTSRQTFLCGGRFQVKVETLAPCGQGDLKAL